MDTAQDRYDAATPPRYEDPPAEEIPMFFLQIDWNGAWITLDTFKTRDDADWQAAKWRTKYGRPTDEGDPFRVVESPHPNPKEDR